MRNLYHLRHFPWVLGITLIVGLGVGQIEAHATGLWYVALFGVFLLGIVLGQAWQFYFTVREEDERTIHVTFGEHGPAPKPQPHEEG